MAPLASRLEGMRLRLTQLQNWFILGLFLLGLAYPLLVGLYHLSLGIEVLIFAILAMSLNLILGYAGLVSFGHAAFFGLGAYLLGFTSIHLSNNLLVTTPVVVVGTALTAALIGFFALRTSGIYFLMITLAFAQMLFSVAIRWSDVTGGSDGLSGIPRAAIGLGAFSYTFQSRESVYYLVLLTFLLSFWLLRRIIDSPFGWTLRGIRENEARMKALGYNTFRYKLAAFMISGVFAGISGLLFAHFFWHVGPDTLYWTTSGEVIVMLIVGGTGTYAGPVLGAAIVRLLPYVVSPITEQWHTIIGLIFIAFVLFAPQGIVGLARQAMKGKSEEQDAAH